MISDRVWSKLYEYLTCFPKIHTRNEEKLRGFVNAVLWVARSGSQWRLLPEKYGNWNTVYKRFSDWAEQGVWYKMLYYFSDDPDMEGVSSVDCKVKSCLGRVRVSNIFY